MSIIPAKAYKITPKIDSSRNDLRLLTYTYNVIFRTLFTIKTSLQSLRAMRFLIAWLSSRCRKKPKNQFQILKTTCLFKSRKFPKGNREFISHDDWRCNKLSTMHIIIYNVTHILIKRPTILYYYIIRIIYNIITPLLNCYRACHITSKFDCHF